MNNKTTPKDFFLYLGIIVSLYASFIAIINLGFELINRAFPDSVSTSYYGDIFYINNIAWPVATLIVLIPVLYIFERAVTKSVLSFPEKKDIWVRKWSIFMTLFLTGATMIVDLITLIYTYMDGEISNRFIFKVLIILVISLITFLYYFSDIRETMYSNNIKRISAYLGLILIVGAIVIGFIVVGSPSTRRALRFDEQRVSHLSTISYEINSYYDLYRKLPRDLGSVKDYYRYTTIQDPESKKEYEYIIKGDDSYSLCATFGKESVMGLETNDNARTAPVFIGQYNNSWAHESGRVCFDRFINRGLIKN